MSNLIGQFNESLLLVNLLKQRGILAVILQELLEVPLVEVVQGATVGNLVLAGLNLTNVV